MVKHKSTKDKKKGSQFVIRVDKSERDAFVALCDRLDTSAAREIRRFMRDLVAAHAGDPTAAKTAAPDTATPAADMINDDTPARDTANPMKNRTPQKSAGLTAED